jgi:hypothetical protein
VGPARALQLCIEGDYTMSLDSSFERLWNGQEFELPSNEEQPNYCVYAREFNEWAQQLCVGAAQQPSIVAINQNKVLLLDKYMQWKASVPKRHRAYTANGPNSHICIFYVFEIAYDRLRVLELSLTPPMLFIPPPSPPPALVQPPPDPPQLGAFIGELDEE